jgi:hypothetical protein
MIYVNKGCKMSDQSVLQKEFKDARDAIPPLQPVKTPDAKVTTVVTSKLPKL